MRFLIVILIISAFSNKAITQLTINEWMASNSIFEDPDFSESVDWIEIKNSSDQDINLSNYYLSDNPNNTAKWKFPEDTWISANSLIVVWADGRDIDLHTNFKLSKSGESILLSQDNELIHSVEFGLQKRNISMGFRDGQKGFFTIPTPGKPNLETLYSDITYEEVSFSHLGGLYSSEFTLDLSSIDGVIRYTIDGSFPDLSSLLYINPITIDSTTIIRARVFKANEIPGKTITHSYFFEEDQLIRDLPVISISTNPEFFWDDSIGIYVQDFKPEWEYPINIELFENDGSDRAAFNELAGVRINGQNSWVLPQKMLGIYFDSDYDNSNLAYPIFNDNDRVEFDNFTLRASGSDWSQTLFRDGLSQELSKSFMDLDRVDFKPSIVYVNGQYLGIHNIRSRIDEGYIEQNFNESDSSYTLLENASVEHGDISDLETLTSRFDADLADPLNYNELLGILDIKNFADYFITEIWTGNSSYGHNVQLWKPKRDGDKWKWILNDLDRSFVNSDKFALEYFTTEPNPESYSYIRNYLNNILENDEFKSFFERRFADHLFTSFNPLHVRKIIDKMARQIHDEMPYHIDRWQGTTSNYGNAIPSMNAWLNEVENLRIFTEQRKDFIEQDLKERLELDNVSLLSLVNFPVKNGQIHFNQISLSDESWAGNYFQNLPISLKAMPNPGHEFEGWFSGRNEILIAKESTWKYFDLGDVDENWKEPSFNDSQWNEGQGILGYGDGNESTNVSFGGNANNKLLSYYFRRSFEIDDLSDYAGLIHIKLLRDDGAVVYLNGHELFRSNMPGTEINEATEAKNSVYEEEELKYFEYDFQTDLFVEGENILAVEVHQNNPQSSDLSFDLSLEASFIDLSQFITDDSEINLTLNSDTLIIANYVQTYPCILKDTIWSYQELGIECSPYYINDQIVVMEDAKLKIEPGVELYFDEGAGFLIHGSLNAKGLQDSLIVFKGQKENAPWSSLIFQDSKDTSYLDWCVIENASSGNHRIFHNAAISVFNSSINIDHMTIEDVESNPILAYFSNVELKNSNLYSKVTGDLINVKYGEAIVQNCNFRGNNQVDTDAIDYDEVHDGIIHSNNIYGFYGFNSDGIDLGEKSKNISVKDNFIHQCADKGISVGQQSTTNIFNNIISQCGSGIAVKDVSQAIVDKTTFYNNGIGIYNFEKSIGIGGGITEISNSIISNSYIASIVTDSLSESFSEFTLSDTDTLSGELNYFGHPRFFNPVQYDFRLQQNSDALGSGLDEMNISVDLGAELEHYVPQSELMISGIHYNPGLHADFEFIEIYNPSNDPINLNGFQLTGAIDHVFNEYVIEPNASVRIVKNSTLHAAAIEPILEWDSGRLDNSGEQILLRNPSGIVVDHVEYDDEFPWPESANGKGEFLKIKSYELDNHFAESWTSSTFELNLNPRNSSSEFSVFPNPSTGFLFIVSKDILIDSIDVFDPMGRKILEETGIGKEQYFLNLQNLSRGTYFLLINESEYTKVAVIN